MKEKILSVSIASYNAEKFLDKVTDVLNASINVQDSIEMIIVNDGSKDGTSTKAEELRKKWPKSIVVINKNNGGYGSTINEAIKVASGKYFKVLDSDDWFEPSNIEKFISFLHDQNAELIVSPYYRVYEKEETVELVDRHKSSGTYFEPLHMHEICVKTKSYRKLNFFIDEHCFYTDTEYAFACMTISDKIIKFDKPIYCYRIGRDGQSVSIASRIKNINDSDRVAKRCISIFNCLEKQNLNSLILKKATTNMVEVQYYTLALLDEKECKNKIKEFDTYVKKENNNIYKDVTRRIKLLRIIRFSSIKLIKKLLQ